MSILNNLSDSFNIDSSQIPSTEEEINKLKEFCTINVPLDYIELIREATEIEMNVDNKMYIRIWGALGSIEMNEAYNIQQYIPASLAVGDDEGGRALIYLNGKSGYGLYLIGFGDLDIEGAEYVAPSLEELLTRNYGINQLMID
ncbi:SMI1/KNR4 family protein [Alkalihalobacillus sp. R86527]|uniref:SMI1/KNR4 family protein n=1 Tax=Alkalihalobacillus sp. R86527 TaxID=3093863 RepID=UPI00366AC56F